MVRFVKDEREQPVSWLTWPDYWFSQSHDHEKRIQLHKLKDLLFTMVQLHS